MPLPDANAKPCSPKSNTYTHSLGETLTQKNDKNSNPFFVISCFVFGSWSWCTRNACNDSQHWTTATTAAAATANSYVCPKGCHEFEWEKWNCCRCFFFSSLLSSVSQCLCVKTAAASTGIRNTSTRKQFHSLRVIHILSSGRSPCGTVLALVTVFVASCFCDEFRIRYIYDRLLSFVVVHSADHCQRSHIQTNSPWVLPIKYYIIIIMIIK